MTKEQQLEESTEIKDLEVEAAEGEANENSEEPVKKGLEGPLKWGVFIGGPGIVIGIVVAVLYFLGVFGESEGDVQAEKTEPEVIPISEQLHEVFSYNLPSMLINLRTTGRRTSFLKISISLEVKGTEENKKEMDQLKPRIIDQFQTYLRELEVDDLQGSAGLQRLKEELLDRVNAVTAPIRVQNVLFGELLVQ